MRVLALDTSTHQGSVALIEDGRALTSALHAEPNAHAERLLALVDRVIVEAGWSRRDLDRVAVGVGPGSFTGLRVGIALAQGIALGLSLPIVGVGSLAAMACAVPTSVAGLRCCVVDARRGEVFLALYDAAGAELAAPRAVGRRSALSEIEALTGGGAHVLVGEVASELSEAPAPAVYRSPESDLPHARFIGVLGAGLPLDGRRVEPSYVREPDAAKPAVAPDALLATLAREPGA